MSPTLDQMHEARTALDSPLFKGLPGDIEVSFEFFPPKTEKMGATLCMMLRADHDAGNVRPSLWDSAVEIDQLRQSGIANCDIRRLIRRDYLEHAAENTAERHWVQFSPR